MLWYKNGAPRLHHVKPQFINLELHPFNSTQIKPPPLFYSTIEGGFFELSVFRGAVQLDVSDYDSYEKFMKEAVGELGGIDILVCNAAILISGAITELSADKWKKIIDVNLCGFFNTVKEAVPYMDEGAAIVQINSKSGKKGSFKNSAYAASKFGGIGLIQSLALELAPVKIRVNAICPGNLLDSPLWTNSLFKQYAKNQGITEEQVRQKYINQVPLKRGCQYEDVANLLVFLASDDASSGQAVNVTGGQQMS